MANLTGSLLKEMIKESHSRIKNNQSYLNDLNVFPVPDGDTGLNMAITMSKVVEELEKNDPELTIKEAAKAIAKGAFIGAKGNSGVILSQFFVGFAKTIEDVDLVTTKVFSDALIEGSKRAYKAVMNPKEGTILTVVKETAEAAKFKTNEGASWKEVVEHCYNIAQKSTAETPNLLEDLKKAGVIDAGALGFVYLLQGWLFVITSSLKGPRIIDVREDLENIHNRVDVHSTLDGLSFRYCTEAMIYDSKSDTDTIKKELKELGDSLLLIEEDEELKLHIHSNHPKQTITKFMDHGKLKAVKIDDMKTQTIESH